MQRQLVHGPRRRLSPRDESLRRGGGGGCPRLRSKLRFEAPRPPRPPPVARHTSFIGVFGAAAVRGPKARNRVPPPSTNRLQQAVSACNRFYSVFFAPCLAKPRCSVPCKIRRSFIGGVHGESIDTASVLAQIHLSKTDLSSKEEVRVLVKDIHTAAFVYPHCEWNLQV